MISIDDLPIFEDVDRKIRLVNSGSYSSVYLISKKLNLVAKILFDHPERSSIDQLEKEYFIQQELYDGNISVPKPEGVFVLRDVAIPNFHNLLHPALPALVMEYVSGKEFGNLSLKEHYLAETLHAQELAKARELGFITPLDHNPGQNCLYRLEEGRVILFDFGNWVIA